MDNYLFLRSFHVLMCVILVVIWFVMRSTSEPIIGIADFTSRINHERHFVLYYGSRCPHSQRLLPIWRATSQISSKYGILSADSPAKAVMEAETKDVVDGSVVTHMLKIDCMVNPQLCASQRVYGYPTMRYYRPSQTSLRYSGPRSARAMKDFLIRMRHDVTPSDWMVGLRGPDGGWSTPAAKSGKVLPRNEAGVAIITDRGFKEGALSRGVFLVKYFAPWCEHCAAMARYYAQLSKRGVTATLSGSKDLDSPEMHSVTVSEVNCDTEVTICTINKINGYPTIVLYFDGMEVATYDQFVPSDGSTLPADLEVGDDDDMEQFYTEIQSFVNERLAALTELRNSQQGRVPEPVLVEQLVLDLNAQFFAQQRRKPVLMFVKWFAPWCTHCQRLAPVWQQLAVRLQSLSNKIRVARVNCVQENALCTSHKITAYPTLQIIKLSEPNKIEIIESYTGPRDLSALYNFIIGVLSSSNL